MKDIASLIAGKTGFRLDEFNKKLSGSQLNSMLMHLFKVQVKKTSAKEVLRQFRKSRFCIPSAVDPIAFKELEIEWLKAAQEEGFTGVTLSPLTPLGSCAVVADVDQNNIVGAGRGMEVVSDVTNVLALMIATLEQKQEKTAVRKFATTHRHVRAQSLNNPAHSAHFGVFCLVTAGKDTGNYAFEIQNLFEHIHVHASLLSRYFGNENVIVKLYNKGQNDRFDQQLESSLQHYRPAFRVIKETAVDTGSYYQLIRFKIFVQYNNSEINMTDGGVVDWTQKLLSNNKHRLFISGSGLELVYKFSRGEI